MATVGTITRSSRHVMAMWIADAANRAAVTILSWYAIAQEISFTRDVGSSLNCLIASSKDEITADSALNLPPGFTCFLKIVKVMRIKRAVSVAVATVIMIPETLPR